MSKTFYVSTDERYPDYHLEEPYPPEPGLNITLTDEEYEDYLRVCREYRQWQDRFAAFKKEGDL